MQSGCGNSLRLTQVCQQIRAEYRPIWFRDACIPIRFELSESYFTTFFPKDSAVNYAPKLLQFSWAYGMSNSLPFGEMTYLLQLRASRETFRCAFFPEAFTEPRQFERCDYCSEEQLLQKHDMPDCYNTFDECVCPPWDVPYLEWRDFLVDQMSYTTIISRFVHNDNNAWLQEVREKKVSVHWYCTRMTNDITIKIIQKEPFKLSSSSSALDTARSLLKKWGMVSLEPSSKIDFVLVCEEKDVTIDDNVQMTTSLVRAVTVSRLPVPRAQNNSSVELLE
ncbi:hypothetical protein J1614_002844 [Plenodomus biglobosus]|nr:hypothetical protein J1614_002844 [Plenodomus biglobosus]